MRKIVIKNCDDIIYKNYEFTFDPKEMKDSEAFKYLLCTTDPGDNYTVTFENVTSPKNICQCENMKCQHMQDAETCTIPVTDPSMKIIFLGAVCETCYEVYNYTFPREIAKPGERFA